MGSAKFSFSAFIHEFYDPFLEYHRFAQLQNFQDFQLFYEARSILLHSVLLEFLVYHLCGILLANKFFLLIPQEFVLHFK